MRKIKVLVVDDDNNLAMLLEARLRAADYEVRLANCVAEAYHTFLLFKPHVVLTDIGLGDENGLDLIKRIRRQAGREHNLARLESLQLFGQHRPAGGLGGGEFAGG